MLKDSRYNYSILVVGAKQTFRNRVQGYIEDKYSTIVCSTAKEAISIIEENRTSLGVVIVDISGFLDEDPAAFLEAIKKAGHSEVIFCHKSNLDPDKDVPHVVKLTKMGAHDILQLPDFRELLDWVVERAMGFFDMKNRVFQRSSKEDYPLRINAFLDLLQERKRQGLAITEKEIDLFFPKSNGQTKLPLEDLLNKVNDPPLDEFTDITILIADDEENFRSMTDMMLEPYGYNLIEAGSGEEVLEQLSKNHVDLVLLDVCLGDMTGDELVPILKKNYKDLEIIMVTAFKDIELIVNTIREGAFDFVVKGKRQELIPQKISQALQKRHFEAAISKYLNQA